MGRNILETSLIIESMKDNYKDNIHLPKCFLALTPFLVTFACQEKHIWIRVIVYECLIFRRIVLIHFCFVHGNAGKNEIRRKLKSELKSELKGYHAKEREWKNQPKTRKIVLWVAYYGKSMNIWHCRYCQPGRPMLEYLAQANSRRPFTFVFAKRKIAKSPNKCLLWELLMSTVEYRFFKRSISQSFGWKVLSPELHHLVKHCSLTYNLLTPDFYQPIFDSFTDSENRETTVTV